MEHDKEARWSNRGGFSGVCGLPILDSLTMILVTSSPLIFFSSVDKTKKKSKILSRLSIPSHENIYTVPNILTFSRLLAAPVVGYLLVHGYHGPALSLLAYAGITDLIDGHIARRYNLQTVVGTIIDPMADKILMTISVVCLALNGSLPREYLIPSFAHLFHGFFSYIWQGRCH